MPKRQLKYASILDEDSLFEVFREHGIKPIHANVIWKHVIKAGGHGSIHDIPGLPRLVYEVLPPVFGDRFLTSTVVEANTSADATTTKMLIELQDGLRCEAVIMRYDTTTATPNTPGAPSDNEGPSTGNKRATLCVSSEVGCQMGCTFCATGSMGLIGDLTAGEIVEQLVHASRISAIRNIVFMGMGEPLNNYTAVRGAVNAMIDTNRFRLAAGHITVSTVGVIPKIRRLAEDLPNVNLALSLHAPNQSLRTEIVPSGTAHKLEPLMAACDYYHEKSGRKVFVEYVMLGAVNDSEECAHELGLLLGPRRAHMMINLIPWNPILAKDGTHPFAAPDPAGIERFHAILRSDYDLAATIRKTMGQDIDGACGQLALNNGASTANGGGAGVRGRVAAQGQQAAAEDIEDMCRRPTPHNASIQRSRLHDASRGPRTLPRGRTDRTSEVHAGKDMTCEQEDRCCTSEDGAKSAAGDQCGVSATQDDCSVEEPAVWRRFSVSFVPGVTVFTVVMVLLVFVALPVAHTRLGVPWTLFR